MPIAPLVRSAILSAVRKGVALDLAAHGAGISLATVRREGIAFAFDLSIAVRPMNPSPAPRRAVLVIEPDVFSVFAVHPHGVVAHSGLDGPAASSMLLAYGPELLTVATLDLDDQAAERRLLALGKLATDPNPWPARGGWAMKGASGADTLEQLRGMVERPTDPRHSNPWPEYGPRSRAA